MHSRNILLRLSGKPAKWNQKSAGNLSRRRNSPIPMSQAFESSSLLKNTAAKVNSGRGLVAGHATVARFVDEYAHVRILSTHDGAGFQIHHRRRNGCRKSPLPKLIVAAWPLSSLCRPPYQTAKSAGQKCDASMLQTTEWRGHVLGANHLAAHLSPDVIPRPVRRAKRRGPSLMPDLTPNRLPSAKRAMPDAVKVCRGR